MKKILLICAAVFAMGTGFLFAQSSQKLEFAAKDIFNKNISSAVFEDCDLTMVNIWGTFCGPCISEMPDLALLNKNNAARNFQVVGIVIDSVNRKGQPSAKTIEAAKTIAKQTGADYLHIVPDSKLLEGILKDVYAVPTTVFVDKNGNIKGDVYTGSRSLSDWQKIVDGLLK